MKKIMIVVPYLYDGGAERVASLWANGLAATSNYEVYLLTYYRLDKEYLIDDRVKRLTLCDNSIEYKKISFLKKIRLLKKIFLKYEIDIIVPFLFHTCIACSMANQKAKVVHTVRNNPWIEPQGFLKRFLRNHFVYKDKMVIVQNDEQLEFFNKNKTKIFVIGNPVNPSCLITTKSTYHKVKKMISIGRLCDQKNFDLLIDVVYKLKNDYNLEIICDIYGDGPNKDYLQNYINDKSLTNFVHLKGNESNIFEVEKDYDLFLMTSKYEGFPNALLEAMAIGMPVLSTNFKTGPKSLIIDKENGFLVESNLDSIARKIYELKDKNLKDIGLKARNSVVSKYSLESIIDKLCDVIDSI